MNATYHNSSAEYAKAFASDPTQTFSGMCYYKGWNCCLVIGSEAEFHRVRKAGEEMLVDGLKHGVSLAEQKEDAIKYLNNMTEYYENKVELPEETHLMFWFMVSALLKLKAIKEDNENGFSALYKFVSEKTETETLEECCVCLEDKKINWRCKTCKAGLICNGCRKKVKHSCVGCPVCRSV